MRRVPSFQYKERRDGENSCQIRNLCMRALQLLDSLALQTVGQIKAKLFQGKRSTRYAAMYDVIINHKRTCGLENHWP